MGCCNRNDPKLQCLPFVHSKETVFTLKQFHLIKSGTKQDKAGTKQFRKQSL